MRCLEPAVVLLRLFIADLLDFLLLLTHQFLPDRLIYLDYAQSLGGLGHLVDL